jgi:hypothetical protein
MLETEAVQAAVLAAAGDVQSLMNHLGLAARSAPTAKLVFEPDLQASLRRALQFGRAEASAVDTPLGKGGVLAKATDVVVAGKSRVPQLAMEVRWHPRGEDHAGFANWAIWDITKMAVAKSREAVEQATVLVAAPSRFWRWLPSYAADRMGYDLLNPEPETPVSTKTEFLSGPTWDFMFAEGMDPELPDRLWTALAGTAEVRSPWADLELRLFDVKGLGAFSDVRGEG